MVGYLLHYWPFFIMGRALFIHHYLPALIFSFCIAATVMDVVGSLSGKASWIAAVVILAGLAACFYTFAPFSYGLPLTPEGIASRKWISTWDFQFAPRSD